MAIRRMFSSRIINSAKFLKMPISSQALYFHLGLNADDDGIVEAYNILNIVGCSEDDLRVLVAKGFVKVLNEDLVAYITDWTENNKIRADRKIDSIYKDLLLSVCPEAQLIEKRQRADVMKKKKLITGRAMDNQWTSTGQPMDNQWTTTGQPMDGIGKVRLGKDRLGKDRLGKDRLGEESEEGIIEGSREKKDYKKIMDLYNQICVSFPHIKTLSNTRQKALKARLKTYSMEDFQKLFEKAEASDFMKGKNNRNWSATFDWMIKDSNMTKILEGNYDNKKQIPTFNSLNNGEAMLENIYQNIVKWAEGDE